MGSAAEIRPIVIKIILKFQILVCIIEMELNSMKYEIQGHSCFFEIASKFWYRNIYDS